MLAEKTVHFSGPGPYDGHNPCENHKNSSQHPAAVPSTNDLAAKSLTMCYQLLACNKCQLFVIKHCLRNSLNVNLQRKRRNTNKKDFLSSVLFRNQCVQCECNYCILVHLFSILIHIPPFGSREALAISGTILSMVFSHGSSL